MTHWLADKVDATNIDILNTGIIKIRRRCEWMGKIRRQPTFKRQRFLLEFVRQPNNGVTATDLQKLIFLHTMTEGSNHYEFVPYKYGSYSFQLKEDLDILEKSGFIKLEYVQGSTKIKAIGDFTKEASFRIVSERGKALIKRAYHEHPYYAINSLVCFISIV